MTASLDEPIALPPGAVWSEELGAFELCAEDEAGHRQGVCELFRRDGTPLGRMSYEAGVREGPFRTYHPSGQPAREGLYRQGKLHGLLVIHRSDEPGGSLLRACCVPPGAAEFRSLYDAGTLLSEIFYDAEGRPLSANGKPWPERPPAVPPDAEYAADEARWRFRQRGAQGGETVIGFDAAGTLLEERHFQRGRCRRLRKFASSGATSEERFFDERGALDGDGFRRYGQAEPSPYADPAIREERGAFAAGQPVGVWRFLDEAGQVILEVDRGHALGSDAAKSSPALMGDFEETSELWALVKELGEQGRPREALCAAARAAARDGDRPRLAAFFAERVVPLVPTLAAERALELARARDVTPGRLLDALLTGADPAEVLRLLGARFGAGRAAAELLEASLLLAPERAAARLSRALLSLDLGNPEAALVDAASLEAENPGAAESVRELARVWYAEFRFGPDEAAVEAPEAELMPVTATQSLSAVRRAIGVYATRLEHVRQALRTRLGPVEPAWLPPDTSALLPDGPLELRHESALITDEDEDGSETSEVKIDEPIQIEGRSAAELLCAARADWNALAWLCWSAGLGRVALPESIGERSEFAAAVNQAIQRCWRAHDQLRSAGLVSRSKGVPGFRFRGIAVESLSPRLAELAAGEYRELRAMFLWLIFPQNLSPFQSDLRQV